MTSRIGSTGYTAQASRSPLEAKIATFLWPDYKELEMLPENEREEVKVKVRALITEPAQAAAGEGQAGVADEDDPAPLGDATDPPPPKVPRLDRYQKFRVHRTAEPQDEVDRYLATSASVPLDQLLKHWKMLDCPDGLSKLAKLALRELGKLATAAPSERVWSKAGFILNKRRNRLTPKHINSIIVLASYLRLKNKRKQ
ncbi:Zinc finger protein 618 [Frankliniella fusca]|uniref:Zinc finger protein 618 n=1 Tax=Frankliniella fusca TaxID=407009 RepID=A0AAE1LMR6_9NEOP|nr:Zinc finger protein 618 [Frankliniella fusca]